MTPSALPAVDTPALLIDLDVVKRNLERMQEKASTYEVALRPHIKTHKIPQLALMQMSLGACGITAAKVSEAEVMAQAGIDDIFIANQIVAKEKLERLSGLASKVRVSLGLDSVDAARRLSDVFVAAGRTIDYLIEIDTGLNRCGVLPGKAAVDLLKAVDTLPALRFKGIFTHAGQVYGARSLSEVLEISRRESEGVAETAQALHRIGVSSRITSVGSTPTMKVWEGHRAINEIRPGNYIFNDAMQVSLGVAQAEDCALTVLATVTSRPVKTRAVIDAGSKVLALDKGARGFGLVLGKNAILERLFEEHGVMVLDPDEDVDIGDRIRLIPNHACPVINLFDWAYGITNSQIVEEFRIAARGKSQ